MVSRFMVSTVLDNMTRTRILKIGPSRRRGRHDFAAKGAVVSNTDPPFDTPSGSTPSLLRRSAGRISCLGGDAVFRRDMSLAMVAYAALLIPTIIVVNANESSDWRYAVAVLPILPLGFLLAAWVRFYRRMDELLQRMELEALAFAFGGTAVITFTYGVLQGAGFPAISAFVVWPL